MHMHWKSASSTKSLIRILKWSYNFSVSQYVCCKVSSLPGLGSRVLDQHRQCTGQCQMNAKSRFHMRLAQCELDLAQYYFGHTNLIVHMHFREFNIMQLGEILVHAQDRQSTLNYISKTWGAHLVHVDKLKGLCGNNVRTRKGNRWCFVEIDR